MDIQWTTQWARWVQTIESTCARLFLNVPGLITCPFNPYPRSHAIMCCHMTSHMPIPLILIRWGGTWGHTACKARTFLRKCWKIKRRPFQLLWWTRPPPSRRQRRLMSSRQGSRMSRMLRGRRYWQWVCLRCQNVRLRSINHMLFPFIFVPEYSDIFISAINHLVKFLQGVLSGIFDKMRLLSTLIVATMTRLKLWCKSFLSLTTIHTFWSLDFGITYGQTADFNNQFFPEAMKMPYFAVCDIMHHFAVRCFRVSHCLLNMFSVANRVGIFIAKSVCLWSPHSETRWRPC